MFYIIPDILNVVVLLLPLIFAAIYSNYKWYFSREYAEARRKYANFGIYRMYNKNKDFYPFWVVPVQLGWAILNLIPLT